MRSTLNNLFNLGVSFGSGMFDKRRIRLTNIFSLLGIGILMVFGIMNIAVGDVPNALRLFAGILFLYAPVYYLNYLGKIKVARVYLALTTISFTTLIGFNSIGEQEQRFNEYLMIGIAAFILFLFDGHLKNVLFVICWLLGMGMHITRWMTLFPTVNSDIALAVSNMSIGFVCVFIFSRVFKKELEIAINQSNVRSERIREQSHLLEKRTFMLKSILDTVPVFIAMVDTNGKYLVVNKKYEEAFGKQASEIVGRSASLFLSAEWNETHEGNIERGLRGLETEIDQEIILMGSSEKRHFFGKMVPVKDDHGEIIARVDFAVDITSVKKIEAELNYANKQKNRLISILAHDIRSPLSQFEMLINVGINSGLSGEKFSVFMKQLQKKFQPLNQSIEGLLEWSRVQLNQVAPQVAKFKPDEVVNQEIEMLRTLINEKDIHIAIKGDLEALFMDKEHFRIAFRNLLHNAVKFTPEKGEIQIRWSKSTRPCLEIIDNGVGFSEGKIEKILQGQIVRSDPGTSGEVGTGLGINLIMALLEKNNCTLEIERATVGSIVRITFPNVKESKVPETTAEFQ